LSGDVLSQRVSELKPMMFSQVEAEFPKLVEVEEKVKTVLGEFGIPSWQNPPYLNYSRALYKLSKRFCGNQLRKMANVALVKWQALDLAKDILEAIRDTVFSLTAPTS
ncbi:MAG: hypothetical protein ABIK18_03985, partial [candidate division WOR-3 bacterium]